MSDIAGETEFRGARPVPRLNGWIVLLYLFGFFGVIFAVNGVMIYEALSTLSGLDTDSTYEAGRKFEHEVAMAKAQDARQWRVDATVTLSSAGRRVEIIARDAHDAPIRGVDASILLERPTDRRLDRSVAVAEDTPGHFLGVVSAEPGQWDLIIAFSRHGEQLFRSKNRILIK